MIVKMSDIVSVLSLSISICMFVYNVRLNKKIYGPKIKILFQKQWEYDEYKNVVESRYADYNIVLTNDSKYTVYDFYGRYELYNNHEKLENIEGIYDIGFLNRKIDTLVSNQIYKSYFANFTKLKKKGIVKIHFEFKYKVGKKDKKYYKEYFDIDVITLANTSEMRLSR